MFSEKKVVKRNIKLQVSLSTPQQDLPSNLNDNISLTNEVASPYASDSLPSYFSYLAEP